MKATPIAGRARVPPVRPLAPDGERPDDLRREPPHGALSERPERRPPTVRPVLRGWPHPLGFPPGGRRPVRSRRVPRAAHRRALGRPPGAAGPRDPRGPPRDGGARPPRRGRRVPGADVGRPPVSRPPVSLRWPRGDLPPPPPLPRRRGRPPPS